jgi:hypothetical protein
VDRPLTRVTVESIEVNVYFVCARKATANLIIPEQVRLSKVIICIFPKLLQVDDV